MPTSSLQAPGQAKQHLHKPCGRYSGNSFLCRIFRLSAPQLCLSSKENRGKVGKRSQAILDTSHIYTELSPVIQERLLGRTAVRRQSSQPISGHALPKFLTGVSRKEKVISSQKTKIWKADSFWGKCPQILATGSLKNHMDKSESVWQER